MVEFSELAAQHPWVLFLAIAILPGLGAPNCPMLIVCGTVMAPVLGIGGAALFAIAAVAVNILWTWWLAAAYPLRSFLQERVRHGTVDRFQMGERSVLGITVLLHITPGVPLFIQNYFPGLHRLAYWKYLAVALPVQSVYTALIVVGSGEIFGALKRYSLTVLIAVLVVFAAVPIQRWIRTKSAA